MTLPPIYRRAFWRNTTAVDRDLMAVGVCLTLETGETVRYALGVIEARELAETILESLSRAIDAVSTQKDLRDDQPVIADPTASDLSHT